MGVVRGVVSMGVFPISVRRYAWGSVLRTGAEIGDRFNTESPAQCYRCGLARLLRMGVPGIPHRVTQRGNHTHRQGNWYPIPGLFPVSYDLAGNTTNDGTTTYTYDADGRVCALSGPQGMIGYQYDADGNRIGKGTVTTIATCDITANGYTPITDYVLDQAGAQMTEMAISGTQSTFVHSNVTGSGALLVTFDSTYATHYYLNDALGSRRVQTDAAGIPEQTCQSLPFGDQLFCSGSITSPTEHHYTGKERDNESGLDYFGARYYGSNMGRFMSPDWAAKAEPVPYAKMDNPQSLNLYAYAGNNPVGNVDADGHIYNGSSDSGGYLEGDDPYHQDQQRAAEFAQMVQNGWEATVNQINSEAESEAPAQQQSTTSSTSTTGTTAQDHYVSISYWPTGAGGFGHIGVQVDSDDTLNTPRMVTLQRISITIFRSRLTRPRRCKGQWQPGLQTPGITTYSSTTVRVSLKACFVPEEFGHLTPRYLGRLSCTEYCRWSTENNE